MSELLQRETAELGLREHADEPAPIVYENRRSMRVLKRLVLDHRGITCDYGRRQVTAAWDEVYGVQLKPDHCLVRLAGRRLKVDRRYGDWREFAEQVGARAVLLQPSATPREVTRERIAEWLGIAPDGMLTCGFRHQKLLGWGLIGCYLLAVIAMSTGGSGGAAGGMVSLLMMGVFILISANNVTADVDGITMRVRGRPRAFAWSEIEQVSDSGQGITVTTSRGKFALSNNLPNSQNLRQALRHIAASQQLGLVLPDERPISETALSRSSGTTPAAEALERGLSRSGDEA